VLPAIDEVDPPIFHADQRASGTWYRHTLEFPGSAHSMKHHHKVPAGPASPAWMLVRAIGFSFFMGTVAMSIGAGSEFTALNTIMSPLVCPGDVIVASWEYSGPHHLSSGPDLSTRWICVNESTGEAHVAGFRTILTAGTVYGLLIAIAIGLWWWRVGSKREAKA
jgi:hypothetical protein